MTRGRSTATPERLVEAHRLRGQGRSYKEIALALGVGLSTIHGWINDPGMVARAGGARDGQGRRP